MYNEIDRIIDEPVQEKVLKDKIEEMITGDLMSNQTSASQCAKLVLYDMNGGGWSHEAGAIDRLRSVTPAAIQKAAGKYLRNFNFAVLGHSDQIDPTFFTSR